ncbi:hypothetical protein BpHYR1_023832 [Brachionus plicatilis]|uniref:Uncharacterized protein n=1 Tax=Brachionus plicatilis TaxID=10195 RepID=A0A3M7PQJ6_BRAPC|nr:hypothetical protein BpHYR1_023832 [Brachionus plicatilis]
METFKCQSLVHTPEPDQILSNEVESNKYFIAKEQFVSHVTKRFDGCQSSDQNGAENKSENKNAQTVIWMRFDRLRGGDASLSDLVAFQFVKLIVQIAAAF